MAQEELDELEQLLAEAESEVNSIETAYTVKIILYIKGTGL